MNWLHSLEKKIVKEVRKGKCGCQGEDGSNICTYVLLICTSPEIMDELHQTYKTNGSAADIYEEAVVYGDVRVGETTQLEVAVKISILDTRRAQAAQATVDEMKVEGIDTNVAIMKVDFHFHFIKFYWHKQ
ncbi:hypothetical protein K1719_029055 [Acacia pycnantha]|nr:hypothetical protein K1719_029055 [Acacia pycnantha]